MRRLLPLLVLACAACAPTQEAIHTPKLRTYNTTEIMGTAQSLMKRVEIDEEQAFSLTKRLEEMLGDSTTKARLESPGCNGVGVFEFGGGGFIIGGGAGGGLVCFAGGAQLEPFSASEVSIGATVGGDDTHGLFLIFGLEHEERFTDGYTFSGTGGTMAQTSFQVGQATPSRGTHVIQYLGSGTGVKADASFGKGELVLDRDKDLEEPAEPAEGE